MENDQTEVSLDLYFNRKDSKFTHFKLFEDTYEILSDYIHIPIDKNKFIYGNDILPSKIELLNKVTNYTISHIFNLYFGANIGQCFLGNIKGSTYELLFKDIDSLKISKEDLDLSKYDDLGTENRKRTLLINCPFEDININGHKFVFSDFKYSCFQGNSIQYSIYSLEKNLICSSEIEIIKIIEDIPKYIDEHKKTLIEFYSKVEKYLNEEETLIIESPKELVNLYKEIQSFDIQFMNYQEKKLEKDLDNLVYVDYFFIKSFYEIFCNKVNKISKNKKYLKKIFNFLEKYKTKIKNDFSLTTFQKIIIIRTYCYLFMKSSSLENFKRQNFQYYIISRADNNSIFDLCFKFINSFIDKLTIKSKLFFPLLQINSGIGYYTEEQNVYSFSMINLKMLKDHLREIIPTILFFHKCKGTSNAAITYPPDGSIIINTNLIFNKTDISLFEKKLKNEVELKKGKNIAIILFRYLLHEMMGHKKFMYKNYNISDSPKRAVTPNNELITLVNENNKVENDNFWKILTDYNTSRGDSGHYLEGFLGKYGDIFIINLFDITPNLGFLLDNVELFVSDDLSLLENSIIGTYALDDIELEERVKIGKKFMKNNNLEISKEAKNITSDNIFQDKKKVKHIIIEKQKNIFEEKQKKLYIKDENKEKSEKNVEKNLEEDDEKNCKEKSEEKNEENSEDYSKNQNESSESNEYNEDSEDNEDEEEDSLEEENFRKKVKEVCTKFKYSEVKKILSNSELDDETKHIYNKASSILRFKDYNPFVYYDKKT